jgi:hypothetical protein
MHPVLGNKWAGSMPLKQGRSDGGEHGQKLQRTCKERVGVKEGRNK